MPEWLLPAFATLGGGVGLGAIIRALFDARGSAQTRKQEALNAADKQANALVDQYQEDRTADRAQLRAYADKVDEALGHLQVEREYSSDLYAWGLAGAPPPPPMRRVIVITSPPLAT